MSSHIPLSRAVVVTAALTAAALAIPLVAMQLTREVNWGIGDFAAAGALLFVAGMGYFIATRRTRSALKTFAVAVVVLLVLGTVWAELAVGLFA